MPSRQRQKLNRDANMLGRARQRVLSGVAAAACLLPVCLLAACSNGSEAATPVMLELTTSTSAAPPSTTSTTAASTTTENPEAEILRVYEGHFAYLPTYGAVVNMEALEEFTADPLLGRLVQGFHQYEVDGIVVDQSVYEVHVVSIEVEADKALVFSCNLDAVSLLTKSGDTYVAADEGRFLRTTEVRLVENGWRVVSTEFTNGSRTSCEA